MKKIVEINKNIVIKWTKKIVEINQNISNKRKNSSNEQKNRFVYSHSARPRKCHNQTYS